MAIQSVTSSNLQQPAVARLAAVPDPKAEIKAAQDKDEAVKATESVQANSPQSVTNSLGQTLGQLLNASA